MKRILVYGMTDNPGGMESFFFNYYRRLNSNEIHFDFITDCKDIICRDEIEEKGGKVFFIPKRRESLVRHMLGMRHTAQHYDIIYFNILSASEVFTVLSVKFLKGIRIVVHSHNSSVKTIKRHLRLRGLLDKITDIRIACSNEAADFMFGRNRDKAIIVNNAIDIDKFVYDENMRNKIRCQAGLTGNFVVGHIGRMCYAKNQVFLIEVFAEILKIEPNAKLVVVGGGESEYRNEVTRKISELKIEDSVILAGIQSNPNAWLQAMDVFALPSRFEGLPLVAIEAQAAGLPCIFADTFSHESDITGNVTFLAKDASAREWADTIIACKGLQRFEVYQEIDAAGYNINKASAKFEELLLSI